MVDDVCLQLVNILTDLSFEDFIADEEEDLEDGFEDDEELKGDLQEMKKIEGELQISLALLLGDVFKSHKELATDAAK